VLDGKRGECQSLGLPVITREGCGMTCESKKHDPPPSAQIKVQALILPRTVKMCGDSNNAKPCTDYRPTNRIEYDFRIGW
jgi:hypothetical protein